MKLAVLFGGISSEHDISCLSAASILRNLNKDKYEIYPVGITRDGEWFYCPDCDPDRVESGAWERMTGKVKVVLAPDRGMHGMVLLREGEIEIVRLDCVFPVLHGVGGEDGTMQGLLELAGIPYVGCGVAASANTMDKALTKKVVEGTGVRQARYYLALRYDFERNAEAVVAAAAETLGAFPVFVKPCSQGSSVGVAKANNMLELAEGLTDFGFDRNLYQFARLDRKVAVVTDSGVPAQYAQRVADQCREAKIITVPQGEASKSFKILETVLRQMLEFNMGRGDLVVAVGGGVVGDLAGFAAAIYMRGIDFINCPTTTLSMIDSSIGGKTAVDLGDTKNIVGAFWQPKLVIVDPDTLSTLPRRHFINGLAEAVKAGLLADPELFSIFEKEDVDDRIGEIICRSLRFKKSIVEQDETEQGMRKALNFGHTIGHGIEAVKGIKGRRTTGLFHGECVALGMLPMIESKALQKRVRGVYRRLGLPTRTAYDKEKVLAEMLHDKKAQGGQITIIKVPGLGCWRAETIPVEGLRPLLGMED